MNYKCPECGSKSNFKMSSQVMRWEECKINMDYLTCVECNHSDRMEKFRMCAFESKLYRILNRKFPMTCGNTVVEDTKDEIMKLIKEEW